VFACSLMNNTKHCVLCGLALRVSQRNAAYRTKWLWHWLSHCLIALPLTALQSAKAGTR
jgi:hypothetical protein